MSEGWVATRELAVLERMSQEVRLWAVAPRVGRCAHCGQRYAQGALIVCAGLRDWCLVDHIQMGRTTDKRSGS